MNNQINGLRKEIDKIDEDILKLLSKRAKISKKIGIIKRENHKSFLDSHRWQKLLEKNLAKADQLGISAKLVEKLFKLIHQYSLKLQKEL